ncbi:MAG: hypothetical protein DDT42_01458 [candidate division WS2 bacterium]|uniref:Uncharacterized protein n=1 Tax=Psychracetigena formicireducens TaxID=2986056 RepID=A0A9E2BJG6_PSYF1|nr:hypothetical protein [Candidatus Psychracetigena formicireducens]MBT9145585.1 hypothetical protein [Candidatus Psychracetigena formicireducens]
MILKHFLIWRCCFYPHLYRLNLKPLVQYLMKRLYSTKHNHFSFEYSYIAEINGSVVGMLNGFTGKEKRKEEWRTILLMIRFLTLPILKNIVNLIKIKLKYLKKTSQLIGLLIISDKFDNADYYNKRSGSFPRVSGNGYRNHAS